MNIYRRRKHISWIFIAVMWLFVILFDFEDKGIGYFIVIIITVLKLLGEWNGKYSGDKYDGWRQ